MSDVDGAPYSVQGPWIHGGEVELWEAIPALSLLRDNVVPTSHATSFADEATNKTARWLLGAAWILGPDVLYREKLIRRYGIDCIEAPVCVYV